MKRPVMWAGFAIMLMAVFAGFNPTLPSLLMLFATTIFGGHMIKKHAPESYDGFVKLFGLFCAGANFLAGGMIMLATDLPYVDRMSGAFLSFMVGLVIVTLIKVNEGKKTDRDAESD